MISISFLIHSFFFSFARAAEDEQQTSSETTQEEATVAPKTEEKKRPRPPEGFPEIEFIREDVDKTRREEVWKAETLSRYLEQSEAVILGTIVSQRKSMENLGYDHIIEVEVIEWLLGEGEEERITLHVPFNAPYVPGQPESVPPILVNTYDSLIFIDHKDWVVEGNALFVVEGDFAWRNKRPSIFLNPRHDRDWEMELPIDDYVMYQITKVRKITASVARNGKNLDLTQYFRGISLP